MPIVNTSTHNEHIIQTYLHAFTFGNKPCQLYT